jgi:hypothetical protein
MKRRSSRTSFTSSHTPAAAVGQTHSHKKLGEDTPPDGDEEPMWEIRACMLLSGRVRESARCVSGPSEEQEFILEMRWDGKLFWRKRDDQERGRVKRIEEGRKAGGYSWDGETSEGSPGLHTTQPIGGGGGRGSEVSEGRKMIVIEGSR